jgi:hypothetical protein
MSRMLGYSLLGVGALLLLSASLVSIGAAVSLVERMRFGPWLMFADVEFLTILIFLFGGTGVAFLWLGKRLARSRESH